MVMKKLHPRASPLPADMDPALLEEIIHTRFPLQEDSPGQPRTSSTWTVEWWEELGVAEEEMLDAARRMVSRDVIWAETMGVMASRLRHLFYTVSEGGSLFSDMAHGEVGPASKGRTTSSSAPIIHP